MYSKYIIQLNLVVTSLFAFMFIFCHSEFKKQNSPNCSNLSFAAPDYQQELTSLYTLLGLL